MARIKYLPMRVMDAREFDRKGGHRDAEIVLTYETAPQNTLTIVFLDVPANFAAAMVDSRLVVSAEWIYCKGIRWARLLSYGTARLCTPS